MTESAQAEQGDTGQETRDAVRRGGRRQGQSGTRENIIRSAQKLFAERGYRGATTRAIASEARVDSALIHHFFATKEGVFFAAIGDAFQPELIVESVLAPGPGTLGERLIREVLALWDEPETRDPMQALVRSAVGYDNAALLVRDFVTEQVIGPIVAATTASHKDVRMTLIGCELIGLLMVRYMIGIEPMASLPAETVVALLAPVIDHYLNDDLDPLVKP